jgi:hypothetical protein
MPSARTNQPRPADHQSFQPRFQKNLGHGTPRRCSCRLVARRPETGVRRPSAARRSRTRCRDPSPWPPGSGPPPAGCARRNSPTSGRSIRSTGRRCRLAPAAAGGTGAGTPPGQGGGIGHGSEVPGSAAGCVAGWLPAREPWCCRQRFALRAEGARAAAGTAPAPRRRDSAGAVLRRPLPAGCGWNPYLLLS